MIPLLATLLLAVSPTAPATSSTRGSTAARAPEQRPLSAFPDWLRPVVKYGVGGGVALWFLGSLAWIARQKLRQAKTPAAQAAARRWLWRLATAIICATTLLGAGVALSLRTRELLYIWITAPVAVLLPPLLLVWWGKRG